LLVFARRGYDRIIALRFHLAVLLASALASGLAACEKVQENVVLSPQGEQVEFAMETPSDSSYAMVGAVEGTAAGATVDDAEQSARNDVRNKAAALGASLVVVDEDDGAGMPYQDKTKVTIKGRAFKQKD
jgi:hypothetical protein